MSGAPRADCGEFGAQNLQDLFRPLLDEEMPAAKDMGGERVLAHLAPEEHVLLFRLAVPVAAEARHRQCEGRSLPVAIGLAEGIICPKTCQQQAYQLRIGKDLG